MQVLALLVDGRDQLRHGEALQGGQGAPRGGQRRRQRVGFAGHHDPFRDEDFAEHGGGVAGGVLDGHRRPARPLADGVGPGDPDDVAAEVPLEPELPARPAGV